MGLLTSPTHASSRTLPPTSLLISPGKAAWAVYIDVVCINYDGNAYDAAVLAVMAALKNSALQSKPTYPARLPGAAWSDESMSVVCDPDTSYPLPLGRMPLSCTMGVFQS